jgi:hypothetical protein
VTDQVGNRTVATSPNPFYILQSNPDVRTPSSSRIPRACSPAEWALCPGRRRPPSSPSSATWPCSRAVLGRGGGPSGLGERRSLRSYCRLRRGGGRPVTALHQTPPNNLLSAPNGIHDQVLFAPPGVPGVRYVVVVGRRPHLPLAPPSPPPPHPRRHGALSTRRNYPAGRRSLRARPRWARPMAARSYSPRRSSGARDPPCARRTMGVGLFLPDLSVGRLVETPEEITSTIATFHRQDGVASTSRPSTPRAARKVLCDRLLTSSPTPRDLIRAAGRRCNGVLGIARRSSPAPVDRSLRRRAATGGSARGRWPIRRAALTLARLCGNGGAR